MAAMVRSMALRLLRERPATEALAFIGASCLLAKSCSTAALSAPGPMADIEELHACAVREGKTTYIDPVTGYSVFTQLASERLGKCCGSGCRHCAWGHANVNEKRRAALPPPIVVSERAARAKGVPERSLSLAETTGR